MSRWPPKNMQFCRAHQTVSPFDRSLVGCCGQFRRSLWRVLLHIDWWKHQKGWQIRQFLPTKILNMPLTQQSPGIRTRDMYWTRPFQQKGVNLEGLGGWMLVAGILGLYLCSTRVSEKTMFSLMSLAAEDRERVAIQVGLWYGTSLSFWWARTRWNSVCLWCAGSGRDVHVDLWRVGKVMCACVSARAHMYVLLCCFVCAFLRRFLWIRIFSRAHKFIDQSIICSSCANLYIKVRKPRVYVNAFIRIYLNHSTDLFVCASVIKNRGPLTVSSPSLLAQHTMFHMCAILKLRLFLPYNNLPLATQALSSLRADVLETTGSTH